MSSSAAKAVAQHVLLGEQLDLAGAVAQAQKARLAEAAARDDAPSSQIARRPRRSAATLAGVVAELALRRRSAPAANALAQRARPGSASPASTSLANGFSPARAQALRLRAARARRGPLRLAGRGFASPARRSWLSASFRSRRAVAASAASCRCRRSAIKIRLDERVELAVEHAVDVAGLVRRCAGPSPAGRAAARSCGSGCPRRSAPLAAS